MTTLKDRRDRAARLLREAGLAAAAFVPGPNLAYLTGVNLHLMERPTLYVLTADGESLAMMPSLERQKWAAAMPDAITVYWHDSDGPESAFAALSDRIGRGGLLGIEGLHMRASEYRALARALGADALHDADPTLARLRLLKDDTEIAELRQAIQISETALEETLMAGICGRSGHEISGRLKAAMLAHGATGFAFEPIVLSGEEAANPHGDTSARTIGPGDALLIDFGASWGSMHADITRTVFCDHAPEEHAKIYETVLAANQAGRAAARPGDAIGAVDSAATGVLAASPYADMILHKTGHGLGREVHEAPTVVSSNLETLQPGMVFTIEPGLYRDGEIGVRIEDDILMTETGHDCLTGFDRELKTYA